jgi:uncharacterized phosphosugar-binding protein
VSALSELTRQYLDLLATTAEGACRKAEPGIAAAGALLAEAFGADGLAYVFGSGHSHMFAEEGFYRAGGSARVAPVLLGPFMLHESAEHSTHLEREHGWAPKILDAYPIDPATDVLIVVSNSGANPLPVEVAALGKERGLPVVAITSLSYAKASTADGPRLHEIADVVIDNGCPPGDALVDTGLGDRVGPASTVVGMALLNAMLVEATARQIQAGRRPEVYRSAGIPGAAEHNAALADAFRGRIRHL